MDTFRRQDWSTAGCKDRSGSEPHGITVAEKRYRDFWDINAGNLAKDITKLEMESFWRDSSVEMLECWLPKSRVYRPV